mgnify:CR=1 FL=1
MTGAADPQPLLGGYSSSNWRKDYGVFIESVLRREALDGVLQGRWAEQQVTLRVYGRRGIWKSD